MERKCIKCLLVKNLDSFYKSNKSYCKECCKSYRKENDEKNKDIKSEKRKEKYLKHKEELQGKNRFYYAKNKEKITEKQRKFYHGNKDKILKKHKEYQEMSNYSQNYYANHKEEIKRKRKEEYYLNSDRRKYQNNYQKNRRINDHLYRLKLNLRSLCCMSFKNKGIKKRTKTENILGCSFEDFKLYLESKFEPWMNWNNHGLYNGELNCGWDIDHIIPLDIAKTEEDLIKLNYFTNLQPLCSKVNRDIKRNKLYV